ncbi:MAG: molybdopterin-dependent oxidoreductase [Chloroflexi bacterium]|nr:molybdopterin-dependent oxidoreductase [Chloroflexota bacterium]
MDGQRFSFTLNGQSREIIADPKRNLMKVLRDDLHLMGTKEGCDGGECGACTVLLDGKAALACRLPMSRVGGRSVVTIEGLSNSGQLHPLQQAFIEAGAVQCGYCTPGLIMAAKALLDANPNPTKEDIARRLSRNLCRCTGYVKITDAILYAAHLMRGGSPRPKPDSLLWSSVPRIDGYEKVTGKAVFAPDLYRDGMLHAKVLRSPHHHARIVKINLTEAQKMPGVVAVLTAGDVPGANCMRPGGKGWTLLAEEKVQFMGEPVAVVAATSPEVAQKAVGKIKVEYEPLEAVLDAMAALDEKAPQLGPEGNLDFTRNLIHGDVAAGFAQAEVVEENTYTTSFQEHAYLEPDAALSYVDEEGRLVTQTCTQFARPLGPAIANLLGVDTGRVKVVPTYVGGGFGGKYVEHCWMITSLLAFKTGQPVKLVYTREEVMMATKKRFAMNMRYKTGATRDGKLIAVEADLVCNGGAYPIGVQPTGDFPLNVVHAPGPYNVPHVTVRGKAVATNVHKHGAMRGLGGTHAAFVYESQMDILAQRLNIDPLELRLRNAFQLGDQTATGQILDESVGLVATLKAIQPYWEEAKARQTQEPAPSPWRRGIGLASTWRASTPGDQEVFLELQEDGRIWVESKAIEMGQGAYTIFAQIVANELKVPMDSLVITAGSTAMTAGSSATQANGNAILDGARNMKAMLLQMAAEVLEDKEVRLEGGYAVSVANPAHRASLERLAGVAKGKGLSLRQKGTWKARVPSQFDPETGQGNLGQVYGFVSQIAEVEVNTRSGEIRVRRIVAALDAGKVMNPLNLEGQMEGSFLMGIGYALKEAFIPGKTRSFKDYRIPTFQDVPEIKCIFVEEPVPSGPHGAKGAGDIIITATPPSVINAVTNAIGVRIFDLPATPERVLEVLQRR